MTTNDKLGVLNKKKQQQHVNVLSLFSLQWLFNWTDELLGWDKQ